MKESYMAKNSLELKLPWGKKNKQNFHLGPPHHSMQNKEFSHPKKKMDIKVDYAQLPGGPSLWVISRIP